MPVSLSKLNIGFSVNNLNVLLLSFLLASCASTTHFQTYPNLDAPNTPSAVVYVVRPNRAFGAAITAPVYVDRFLIGRIGPGGHLKTRVPVGRVHVTSTTADAVLQTERGAIYFLEVSMPAQMWFYAPDFNVTVIDKRRAREILGYDP